MKVRLLLLIAIVLCFVSAISAVYVTSTQKGARLVMRVFLSRYLQFHDVQIGREEGCFLKGVKFKSVEIHDPAELPKGTLIRMEEIYFAPLFSFTRGWLAFEIHHLRYESPDFTGQLTFKEIRGRPFGGLSVYGVESKFSKVSGEGCVFKIKSFNALFSQGKRPVRGEFRFKKFSVHGIDLADGKGFFDLRLSAAKGENRLDGDIYFGRGTIFWKGNTIHLNSGKIGWSGNPSQPSFDFKGSSVIGNIFIAGALEGKKNALDLRLISDSPLSKKRLFLMLFAGKDWKNIFLAPFVELSQF